MKIREIETFLFSPERGVTLLFVRAVTKGAGISRRLIA